VTDRFSELTDLLEALCESRLTPAEAARLESLALADREALRYYVRYVELHGLLHWDVAGGAAAFETAPAPLVAAASSPRIAPRRTARWIALAVSTLSLAVVAGWFALGRPALFGPAGGPQELAQQGPGDHPSPALRDDAGRNVPASGNSVVHLSPRNTTPTPGEAPPLPPREPSPLVADARPNRSSETMVAVVNRELQRHWAEHGVEPSPPAEDAEWVRRVYLDLAGRIPTADETATYLSSKQPDRRAALVDDLLAGPEFSRHYSVVWTNLLIGHTSPREVNRPALEKFLREQFHRNRPWSETVTRLISAEGYEDDDGATNFLLAHVNNEAVPATAVTSRVLLCEQIQCTQCHNHPTGEWKQDRFWELNSFFQQTDVRRHARTDPQTGRRLPDRLELVNLEVGGPTFYEDRQSKMEVAYPQFDGQTVDPSAGTDRRAELARLLCAGEQPQMARALVNRMWAKFFGYGFTNPVDDMGPHNAAQMPELLDRLSEEFVRAGYDVQQLVRWIVLSDAYQLASAVGPGNAADEPDLGNPPLFSRMYVRPMSAEQLFDSLLTATQADQAGARYWDEVEQRRRTWLEQFYTALDNDENSEEDSFEGSLSQALVMMNGDLIRQATDPKPGTVLQQVLAEPGSDEEKIRLLSLAALSREPAPAELSSLRTLVRRQVQSRGRDVPVQVAVQETFRDLMWAYLNSSEFRSIH
jgi:hypothetical protein